MIIILLYILGYLFLGLITFCITIKVKKQSLSDFDDDEIFTVILWPLAVIITFIFIIIPYISEKILYFMAKNIFRIPITNETVIDEITVNETVVVDEVVVNKTTISRFDLMDMQDAN